MNNLISREALKTIESIQSADFNSIETIREWIDNAPTVPAITIPDNATNGDMIKALFPNQDSDAVDSAALLGLDGYVLSTFPKSWWNAPYKRGETDE